MKRHRKPVVFKYRVLIVIYFSHLFLYINSVCAYLMIYFYIYIYIYIYKFTSKYHSQNALSLEWRQPRPENVFTFLAPSADKETRNYDTECSNHHPSLSTLRSKGLSRFKMKWWANIHNWKSINITCKLSVFISKNLR